MTAGYLAMTAIANAQERFELVRVQTWPTVHGTPVDKVEFTSTSMTRLAGHRIRRRTQC